LLFITSNGCANKKNFFRVFVIHAYQLKGPWKPLVLLWCESCDLPSANKPSITKPFNQLLKSWLTANNIRWKNNYLSLYRCQSLFFRHLIFCRLKNGYVDFNLKSKIGFRNYFIYFCVKNKITSFYLLSTL
jgi:hypothetical protein